jgi:hypothetical protein
VFLFNLLRESALERDISEGMFHIVPGDEVHQDPCLACSNERSCDESLMRREMKEASIRTPRADASSEDGG